MCVPWVSWVIWKSAFSSCVSSRKYLPYLRGFLLPPINNDGIHFILHPTLRKGVPTISSTRIRTNDFMTPTTWHLRVSSRVTSCFDQVFKLFFGMQLLKQFYKMLMKFTCSPDGTPRPEFCTWPREVVSPSNESVWMGRWTWTWVSAPPSWWSWKKQRKRNGNETIIVTDSADEIGISKKLFRPEELREYFHFFFGLFFGLLDMIPARLLVGAGLSVAILGANKYWFV